MFRRDGVFDVAARWGRGEIRKRDRRRRNFDRLRGVAMGAFFVVPARRRAAFIASVKHWSDPSNVGG